MDGPGHHRDGRAGETMTLCAYCSTPLDHARRCWLCGAPNPRAREHVTVQFLTVDEMRAQLGLAPIDAADMGRRIVRAVRDGQRRWARERGLPLSTLHKRLVTGWAIERALGFAP